MLTQVHEANKTVTCPIYNFMFLKGAHKHLLLATMLPRCAPSPSPQPRTSRQITTQQSTTAMSPECGLLRRIEGGIWDRTRFWGINPFRNIGAILLWPEIKPSLQYLKASPVPGGVSMSGPLQVSKLDLVGSIWAAHLHRELHLQKLMCLFPVHLETRYPLHFTEFLEQLGD